MKSPYEDKDSLQGKSPRYLEAVATRILADQKAKAVRREAQRESQRLKQSAAFRKYGICLTDYLKILRGQGFECGICGVRADSDGLILGTKDRLCVDHSHSTLNVRGLLCGHCNTGIGLFFDDPQRLQKAIGYLQSKGDGQIYPQRRNSKQMKALMRRQKQSTHPLAPNSVSQPVVYTSTPSQAEPQH